LGGGYALGRYNGCGKNRRHRQRAELRHFQQKASDDATATRETSLPELRRSGH
jgi:hypothetical protein